MLFPACSRGGSVCHSPLGCGSRLGLLSHWGYQWKCSPWALWRNWASWLLADPSSKFSSILDFFQYDSPFLPRWALTWESPGGVHPSQVHPPSTLSSEFLPPLKTVLHLSVVGIFCVYRCACLSSPGRCLLPFSASIHSTSVASVSLMDMTRLSRVISSRFPPLSPPILDSFHSLFWP